uniref:ZP domain-containing protein n=1 Tax=Steinernema glaseri TaxID=37863 RepID=A0A1I7ZPD2_9BILA
MCAFLTLLLLTLINFAASELIEDPEIICGRQNVKISMKMGQPFKGHVFVRGHYNDPRCHRNFTNQSDMMTPEMDIDFDHCTMRRKRQTNPKGMSMGSVVVVSYHQNFITRRDRAFEVECFYLEESKIVKSDMIVSHLPTTEMMVKPIMPDCNYVVRKENPDDKIASLGDLLIHEWSCHGPAQQLYCMQVHTCTVDDGENAMHQIIDSFGCSLEELVMSNVHYAGDLSASTKSYAFKLPDSSHLYFSCQVQITLKENHNGTCPRQSCDSRTRSKRSLRSDTTVFSSSVLVLDVEDTQKMAIHAHACPLNLTFLVSSLVVIIAQSATIVYLLSRRAAKF